MIDGVQNTVFNYAFAKAISQSPKLLLQKE